MAINPLLKKVKFKKKMKYFNNKQNSLQQVNFRGKMFRGEEENDKFIKEKEVQNNNNNKLKKKVIKNKIQIRNLEYKNLNNNNKLKMILKT